MLANGIQPFATLYHWDLPQSLQDRFGGWEGRETSKAFADYAGYVAARLTDRVKHIFTINEFGAFIEVGYRWGVHAPGLKLTGLRLNQTRHHAVLGHGWRCRRFAPRAKPGTKVGMAENITIRAPVFESPAAHRSGRARDARDERAVSDGDQGREVHRLVPEVGWRRCAEVHAGRSEDHLEPLDFVGINIYTPQFVRADESSPVGFAHVPHPKSFPHAPSFWLFVGPEALYWGPRHVAKLWGVKEIYITENGCSSSDEPAADGRVYDTDRVTYLRSYLTQLRRATAEGVPVRGYFLWSLMDNFEWADGYTNRFGIHYVDSPGSGSGKALPRCVGQRPYQGRSPRFFLHLRRGTASPHIRRRSRNSRSQNLRTECW